MKEIKHMDKRLVFFKASCGVGMEDTSVHNCVGMTDEELSTKAWELAVDCANSFGQYVDNDYDFDDEEDTGYCFTENDLNYYWEEYVPEKHDMKRAGGGSFLEEF